MKLSEPMVRELQRIARASTGRGRRGAADIPHVSTFSALEDRELVTREVTAYGQGVGVVTRLTTKGRQLVKSLGLVALLALLASCAQFSISPEGELKASTFGSASLSATADDEGGVLVEAEGDGTNLAAIFKELFGKAASVFGGSEPPVVNVNVPAMPDTNGAEVAPTE